MITFTLVDQLKSAGRYQHAGALSFILGRDGDYGCHFGLRSELEQARSEFRKGWVQAQEDYVRAMHEPIRPMVTMRNCIEAECHRFVAEASDLGLKPGQWPDHIETDLGNRLPFLLQNYEVHEGDLKSVSYQQCNGCIVLRVFND